MPVYNGERFMKDAIESLLEQTFQDFELLILDNASTDGTQEIALQYERHDSRVKYHRFRENYGLAHNWRMAFKLSSGPFFKWAAYDDTCAPRFVERCLEPLTRDPSVVLAYPLTVGIDSEGSRVKIPAVVGPRYEMTSDYSDQNQAFIRSTVSPDPVVRFSAVLDAMWNAHFIYGVIRSEALSKMSLFPAHYAADHLMLAELSLYGRFCQIPEELFFLRIHTGRTSRTQTLSALSDVASQGERGERTWKLRSGYPQRVGTYQRAVARSPLRAFQRLRCYLAITMAVGRWGKAKAVQSLL